MFKHCFIILALLFSTLAFSQDEESYVFGDNSDEKSNGTSSSGFDWDRITIGGGLGLSFGTLTIIEIAPSIGYYLTDNILVGVGGRYSYYKDNIVNSRTTIYGGRFFG